MIQARGVPSAAEAAAKRAISSGAGSQPKASISTRGAGSAAAALTAAGSLQSITRTPAQPSGAIQASALASSTQSRTRSPRPASWRASRQHTPRSPWLSMTLQKMSQSRCMAASVHLVPFF